MNSTREQWQHALIITLSIVLSPLAGIFGPFNNGNLTGQNGVELFLPAGYAFVIWAVIYVGLFAFGIWQGLPAQADNLRVRRAAPWISATAVSNILWMLFAGSQTTVVLLTLIALLLMQVSGWIAYLRLRDGNPTLSQMERRIQFVLRTYLGWLSVVTIANSAAALNVLGWGRFGIGEVTWTLIMLVVGVMLAWEVGRRMQHDNVYRGVFVWAFVAIWFNQQGQPLVAWTALIAACAVLLMMRLTRSAPATVQPILGQT